MGAQTGSAATAASATPRRRLLGACLLLGLVAAALALHFGWTRERVPTADNVAGNPATVRPLPVLWSVPEFEFGDQLGRRVTHAELRQHVWVANFIFTRCTTVCPMMTARMRALQRQLHDPELRFVSFSVDPANDTTQALRRYAAEWGEDEPRWHLLRTEPESLQKLVDGMRVLARPTSDVDNPILHTSLFFLIDEEGGVRGMYDSDSERALADLSANVRRLLPGAPAARGVDVGALAENAASGGYPAPGGQPASGERSYVALGCRGCHDNPALAPSLRGTWGGRSTLVDGTSVTVDAAYVRESLTAPAAKLVAGYPSAMPAYGGELSPEQLDRVVEHVRSLTSDSEASTPPTSTPAPAAVATDPICGMTVRVTSSTPHTQHDGHDYYFCSEPCRDRFLAAHVD